uniref:DNA-directed RNA polymerase subunit beta'' n=1 Tax=Bracteacoccus aerius TaxID=50041 RepID=A0A140HAT4_9CHLO|nr:RNA polymerase beta subunit [Bracteacoccus aerius]AMO01283.1 RNA polymerase beta subunit [Bracteacoccus aerius]
MKFKSNIFSLIGQGTHSWNKTSNTRMKKCAIKKTKLPSHVNVLKNQTSSLISNQDYSTLFLNCVFDKGRLKAFVLWFLQNYGQKKTIELLEQLKQIGFGYATKAGISLGIDDLRIPAQKRDLLIDAQAKIHEGSVQYKRGEITGVEKFQRLIDTWHQTSENLKQEVIRHFEATDLLNPVYMMAFSGARGNISQVRQLVGMRGLMADPQGRIIDFPIRSNFREGLTLTEYIISSYGARKGIVDTALRTANAGYLTRRLVDVAQHVIVCEFNCKTNRGILVLDMKEGNKTIYSFQNRLLGRVLAKDIFHNQQKIASKNQEVSVKLADAIAKITKKALIRSPLTCETKKLVCQLCYGWSLSTNSLVSIGEAVGIIAAQSIGEPGTQLTMRTFHTGGVFSGGLSDQIIAPNDGIIEYSGPIPGICVRMPQGQIAFLTKAEGNLIFKTSSELLISSQVNPPDNSSSLGSIKSDSTKQSSAHVETPVKMWKIPPYTVLFARNKQKIFKKQIIAQLSSFSLSGEGQKTQTSDAEQTIYAEFEGQIYNSNIDVIEKFNEYNDLSFEAWGWGFLWILAGKIYQYPIQSHVFAQPGDFIGKNSILNRIQWVSNDQFFLDTNFILSNKLADFKNSLHYAQNKFTSLKNPRVFELEKSLNFFQSKNLIEKNLKLSSLTRYQKKFETSKISYDYSKNFKNQTHFNLNQSQMNCWTSASNQKEKLQKIQPKVTKIQSNRLIRTKFFEKQFNVYYWKLINLLHDSTCYSNSYSQKINISNFYYPFHKFLRKRVTTVSKKKLKTRNFYSRKLKNAFWLDSLNSTKPGNFLKRDIAPSHNKNNQTNHAQFFQLNDTKSLNKSAKRFKWVSNLNFRMPIKNQNNIFVYNQSTFLKKWKLLKLVYPYVNKKTIKTKIPSKLINFQKNRILLSDWSNKLEINFPRKFDSKPTLVRLHTKGTFSFPFDVWSTKNQTRVFSAGNQRLKVADPLKTRLKNQKQNSSKKLLFSSNRIAAHGQNIYGKNSLVLNKSNFAQILQRNRNQTKNSINHAIARNSRKSSSLILKKPVLSLTLNTFRYQKLGYHFSYNFRHKCGLTKSTNNLKTTFVSSREGMNNTSLWPLIDQTKKLGFPHDQVFSFSSSWLDSKNPTSQRPKAKDKMNWTYLRKSPLNFSYYVPNKNKDQFFNKFSLKTSLKSIDQLKSKQNTYNWSPMFDFFLQWFPSCYQTLNNGIFIFSSIHLTAPFLFKAKNQLIFSLNRKENFQKTQTFRLNCHQFKQTSRNISSIHKVSCQNFIKPWSNKLPTLKVFGLSNVAKPFSITLDNPSSLDSNVYKNSKKKLVNVYIVRDSNKKSNNKFVEKTSHRIENLKVANRRYQLKYYLLHLKNSNLVTKRHKANHSFIYSINAVQSNLLQNSKKAFRIENRSLPYQSKIVSTFGRLNKKQPLHPINFYVFKTMTREISAIKNVRSQLRWQNKKPKISNINKPFSRLTKKNEFGKKSKSSLSPLTLDQANYNNKSNFAYFSPRSKFSVSWNEIFWIPQEDYKISICPLSSKFSLSVQTKGPVSSVEKLSFDMLSQLDLKNSTKKYLTKVRQFQALTPYIESINFMNVKSKPLFYLTNRQGLKKPFYSLLEGFSKKVIKPAHSKVSPELRRLSDKNRNLFLSETTFHKKTNNTANAFYHMNTKHLSNLQAFIDFSQKILAVSYRFKPINLKQNRISSVNQIYRHLKSDLINFIKTKWQMNDIHECKSDQRISSSSRVLKTNLLNLKNQNQFLFFLKFMPKNTVYSLNSPIASPFCRQQPLFSHFVFQSLNLVKKTLADNNDRTIKKQLKNKSQRKNTNNETSVDYKMHVSIQPGWVYYSLNLNITEMALRHQKIYDFGKFLIDDVLFTNHRVYVKNFVSKISFETFNTQLQNSKCAQTNLSIDIGMKSVIPLETRMRHSGFYSFNLDHSPLFGTAQEDNIKTSLNCNRIYKTDVCISNPKSRYGNSILKYIDKLTHAPSEIKNLFLVDQRENNSQTVQGEQKENMPETVFSKTNSLVLLIRPMQHKILPNLHSYKTKLYRVNKKVSESNFSLLIHKNFHSTILNKQKCDQKLIATFPGIDIKISPNLKLPQVKKIDSVRQSDLWFDPKGKTSKNPIKRTANFSKSKISNKTIHNFSLSTEKTFNENSIYQTSKNIHLAPETKSLRFRVSANKHTRFSNLLFEKTPLRHCFEESYLTFSSINFLPLNLQFSIPSSFHYLFKTPSVTFNSSANINFAEQQLLKSVSPQLNNYVLNNLVLKNQQRFKSIQSNKNVVRFSFSLWSNFSVNPPKAKQNTPILPWLNQKPETISNLMQTKSFLNSLASLSFLPCFDFCLSSKMSYLANQRLFASYFINREFLKNASLLESFGSFPISKNQVGIFQFNKISSNESFANTSFLSSLRGEMLFKPTKNWSSEANLNRCLILTDSDLFCFYLPNVNREIKTAIASDGQKIFENKFSSLYQNFSQLEQIHMDQTVTDKQKINNQNQSENIIVQYNKKFYKIKGLRIASIKSYRKLRLGSLLVYGDLISTKSAIDRAGQIIHMNSSKVTFRRAQPISVSPKGILHAYNQDFVTQNAAVITLPFQTLKTGDIVQGIPKVEQYFEARTTKRGRLYRDSLPNLLQALFERYRTFLPLESAVRQSFLKIQQIIVDGVQRVYRSQGVSIADKHLEVIVRQMTSKVQIVHGGQTGFFPGELVDLEFVEHVNKFLLKKIYYEPVVLGITRASLEVESFLSAASFQQTTKVLSKAAVYRKKDFLKGLKENIIVGNLIPAGTGYVVHLKEFFNMHTKNQTDNA